MAETEQGAFADRDLVYRKCETATFAPRQIAEWVDQIHRALRHSKTWLQFRKLMPPDEYTRLMKEQFDEDDEPRPADRAKFEASMISGVGDGDYPPWLAQRMAEWIPLHLLEKYATYEASRLNGDFWEIPEDDAESLANELRELGYTVTEMPDSEFY
jgi:hypothetical protein